MEAITLGRCDNHADEMACGGLVPKGPRCFNRAAHIAVYDEIDGNTRDTMKLWTSWGRRTSAWLTHRL